MPADRRTQDKKMGMEVLVSFHSANAHTRMGGSAWSVLVLAGGGTPDQSYFQIGGAPSRAHVWTDPGCSLGECTSKLQGSLIGGARLGKARLGAPGLGG